MAHKIIKPQNHSEWLENRKQGIGSSEVGTIIGVNPYETPYELWSRKKGLTPPKQENFLMTAGHYLEEAVSRFFVDATGAQINKSSSADWIVYDPQHTWRRVSPDRFYWENGAKKNEANKRILECKTTQMTIDVDALPRYWFCQLQYQLGVAEVKSGALAWLTQGREFGYKDVNFNAEFFEWMMEQVDRFYTDYILGDAEPELTSIEDIKIKYPNSLAGKTIEAIGDVVINEDGKDVHYDILETCGQLRHIINDISVLEKQKEHLQGVIKNFMGDAEYLTTDNGAKVVNIASWKNNKPTTKIDTKRLTEDYPDIVSRYSKQVDGARVFRFK